MLYMYLYLFLFMYLSLPAVARGRGHPRVWLLSTFEEKNFTLFWLKVQVDAGHFIKPSIEHFFYKKSPYVKFSI